MECELSYAEIRQRAEAKQVVRIQLMSDGVLEKTLRKEETDFRSSDKPLKGKKLEKARLQFAFICAAKTESLLRQVKKDELRRVNMK